MDQLAKESVESGTKVYLGLHRTDFNEQIDLQIKKIHHQEIQNESRYKGTEYFNQYYSPQKSKPWFFKNKAKRLHITTINRIRANHYSLAASLFRKNMTNSAACTCGAETEDIDHVIFHCPKYDQQRKTLKKQFILTAEKYKSQPPTTITQIMKHPESLYAIFITIFLKKCNLSV